MFYYDQISHRNTLEANKLVSKNLENARHLMSSNHVPILSLKWVFKVIKSHCLVQCPVLHLPHTNVSVCCLRLSINEVTHFFRYLTPPSPLSPILLKRLME